MDFQEWFPCIDFERIPGYPNKYKDGWSKNFPKLEGLVVNHVVKFLKYIHGIGKHEDVQIQQFVVSLSLDVQDCIK
jgi:hypothetical protein